MSKKTKLKRKKAGGTKEITAGKLIRLALKSMVFAIIVASVLVVLNVLNVPFARAVWVQFGVMLLVYLIAYPFLMSEFRSKDNQKS